MQDYPLSPYNLNFQDNTEGEVCPQIWDDLPFLR